MSKHPHSSGFRRRRATARALLAVGAVSMMALLLVPYTPADAYGNPLLERRQISHRDLGAFDQWTGILARYEWQHTAARAGCSDNSTCSSAQWEGLLSALKDAPFAVKLEEVNRFFNTVAYVSDEENYGSDYWQTPYEFMARGGDCRGGGGRDGGAATAAAAGGSGCGGAPAPSARGAEGPVSSGT